MKKKNNNAKFVVHYVRLRTHNVRAHALRSHQNEYGQNLSLVELIAVLYIFFSEV